jgi:hypothetical protein
MAGQLDMMLDPYQITPPSFVLPVVGRPRPRTISLNTL